MGAFSGRLGSTVALVPRAHRGGCRLNALTILQKIGKALMTPIAVMPAAAMLLRFGQPDLLNSRPLAMAGAAVFDNLPLLFAVGVAIGLAGDAGVAALSAVVGHVVFTQALAAINADINMGVLSGILVGSLAAVLYNRFKSIRFPDCIGFFGGRRFVPVITALSAMVLGLAFGYLWPPVQHVISDLGGWIGSRGLLGGFVYAVINRLLIPFGLHHILNSMFWFVFGDFTTASGQVVHGDLARFFSGDPTAGIYMTGFFPIMMFGLVGAALAMFHEARPARRRLVGGIMLSAALTSLLTGITEPIEFSFMFIAPALFGLHALLTGLSFVVTAALGIRLGFGYSAGAIDYVLNYHLASRPLLLLPVGLGFGLAYYAIFRIAIRRLNLLTPGREEDPGTGA